MIRKLTGAYATQIHVVVVPLLPYHINTLLIILLSFHQRKVSDYYQKQILSFVYEDGGGNGVVAVIAQRKGNTFFF
jgi:hypothetical protein